MLVNIFNDILTWAIIILAVFGWCMFFAGILRIINNVNYLQSKCNCSSCEIIKRGKKKTKVRCIKCGAIFKVLTRITDARTRTEENNGTNTRNT